MLETTTQYDFTKFTPLGTVIHNNVESVSMLRNFMATIVAPFGGKNFAIQEAVDRLSTRGMAEFKQKVMSTYPGTTRVVGFNTTIAEAGADDQQTCMVLHVSGTCLAPILPSSSDSDSPISASNSTNSVPALAPAPVAAPAPVPAPVAAPVPFALPPRQTGLLAPNPPGYVRPAPAWGGKNTRTNIKSKFNARKTKKNNRN